MRAVNLIPLDQRRAGSAAGRSGGAVYALLGVLALLVAAVGALTLVDNQIRDRRAEVDRLRAETALVQARVDALATYQRFAELAQQRRATVDGLVAGRFDWSHALREVARVVPRNVTLDRLEGTTGAATTGAAATGATTPGATANAPSVTLVGCTSSQAEVARMMARLRALDGVDRVALATSAKGEGSGAGASLGSGDCRLGSDQRPQFSVTTRFRPTAGLSAGQVGAPAAAAATTTPAPAAGGTP